MDILVCTISYDMIEHVCVHYTAHSDRKVPLRNDICNPISHFSPCGVGVLLCAFTGNNTFVLTV
jgi:hypothetical protein